uniref:TEA domain-containing protein n=1 Tax=Macrostomum lignano TaxID=282301 RepID=A0A1I8HBI0_9PLAT
MEPNKAWSTVVPSSVVDDDDMNEEDEEAEEDPNDAEGVWSPDIEQSFQEALALYPPCGRRKIILSDEGKMYGRNELIARYIKLRTGKTRTRKQVSSHIQVLARRKTKEVQTNIKDPATKEKAMHSLSQLSSAQIRRHGPRPGEHRAQAVTGVESSAYQQQRHIFAHINCPMGQLPESAIARMESVDQSQIADKFPAKRGLNDFFDKGPESAAFLVKIWADINTTLPEDHPGNMFYGHTTVYESQESMNLSFSTKVCSFGKQVVEKVEKHISPHSENGKYIYQNERIPMCEYMINFISKLRQLPEKFMMNSVLENFTIMQVVTNTDTGEPLLCIAYVFEVSSSVHGAQRHIYRLSRS